MSIEATTPCSTSDRVKTDSQIDSARKRKQSKIWFVLSLSLSTVILGWGLSLPFRQHDRPLLFWDESDVPRSSSTEVRKVRLSREEAEAYRAEAIQRDREFLRARRDQLRRGHNPNPPNAQDVALAEQARIESLKETVEQLRDAPSHTLAGQYRLELEAEIAKGTDESETQP